MIYAAGVAERGDYSCPNRFCADGFTFRKFETDETWGGADRHFWFRAEVPENVGIPGKPLYLLVRTGVVDIWDTDNPQIIGFLNGRRTASMDMNRQDMLPSGSRGTESGKSRFPFPMRSLRAEYRGLFYEQ